MEHWHKLTIQGFYTFRDWIIAMNCYRIIGADAIGTFGTLPLEHLEPWNIRTKINYLFTNNLLLFFFDAYIIFINFDVIFETILGEFFELIICDFISPYRRFSDPNLLVFPTIFVQTIEYSIVWRKTVGNTRRLESVIRQNGFIKSHMISSKNSPRIVSKIT